MPRIRSLLLVWLLPLSLALGAGFLLRHRTLDLLSVSSKRWCFGDSASAGASRAWTDSGTPWRFGMRLRPGFAYPYAAAGIHLGRIDLDDYDSLVLDVRSRSQRSLRVTIQGVEPGATDTGNGLSLVPFEGGIAVGKDWSRQSLALRDLAIPLWWSQRGGEVARTHPQARKDARRLFLENGLDTPVGTDDTLVVRSLRLEGTRNLPLAVLVPLALLVSGLLQAWLLRRRIRPETQAAQGLPHANVRDIPLEPRRDEETRRLLDWVGEHYMDADLGVEAAARGCGIHPRRIPSVLRAAGLGTFPAFVNSLRVEQAGRLLRETDRTASEIAMAVGVPNVPHFHRLFKAATGRTPLEWRDRARSVSGEG